MSCRSRASETRSRPRTTTVEAPAGDPRASRSQRPAVLARQVTDQPGDVLAGLPPRLHPGKAACQPGHQLIQLPAGQAGLFYSGGSSRLKISSRHKPMFTRRLSQHVPIRPIGPGHPALSGHEVRLSYDERGGIRSGPTKAPGSQTANRLKRDLARWRAAMLAWRAAVLALTITRQYWRAWAPRFPRSAARPGRSGVGPRSLSALAAPAARCGDVHRHCCIAPSLCASGHDHSNARAGQMVIARSSKAMRSRWRPGPRWRCRRGRGAGSARRRDRRRGPALRVAEWVARSGHRQADAASSTSASRMKRVAPTERKKLSAGRSWLSSSAGRPVLTSS